MIHVKGNISFIGNEGTKESDGALSLSGFGQVRMFTDLGAHLKFINNTGM